jgi:RNA polymerase sigma-70 factor (ECF subfamily)
MATVTESSLLTRRSLLSRLRDLDDAESWRTFFDTYWELLYNVARQSGLDDAAAQDVVQEAVIGVARKMPEFHYDPAKGSFKHWLLRIARRRIIDHLRRVYRQPPRAVHAPEVLDEEAPEAVTDPESERIATAWEAEWERRVLAAAIEQVKREVNPKHFQMRAERAEAKTAAALRQSRLEQSRALLQSRAPNRRSAALALLGQAAAIAPGADLRTAAAAALATPEWREVHSWAVSSTDPVGPPLNAAGDTYLRGNNQGILTFHRVSDDALVRTLTNGTRRVENALFSADGRWLVAADKEPSLRLWDLEAGTNRLGRTRVPAMGFAGPSGASADSK